MAKKKILVVDDEVDIIDMVKARFEANNYIVLTASDGEMALTMIDRGKPDTTLLDVLMPRMDGLTVLKNIREKDKSIPHIHIYRLFQ